MPANQPMIALTFDDGPSIYTDGILDMFRQLDCRATFCEVGENCVKHPEQLKRTVAEGHEVICHSWSHPDLTKLSVQEVRSQIEDTRRVIRETAGAECAGMRPPYGSHNESVDALCRELGLFVLTWSMSTEDWDHNNADRTFEAVRQGAEDGAVILCHDRSSTAKAVSMIVPWLREQGYQVVPLRELLAAKGATPAPGSTVTLVKTEK